MDVAIEPSWKEVLKEEFSKEYFIELTNFIKHDIQKHKVYPSGKLIFNAFSHCKFEETRVVIIGQDPYHGPNQANGLCFSVNDHVKQPPSLKNIFKEINEDLGQEIPDSGNLERWSKQGVLLLNSVLTVRASSPGSHRAKGWEKFTDSVIQKISERKDHVVFLLWGSYAQQKGSIIDSSKHHVLQSAHPSPFSVHRGFYGNKHFSKTNDYLKENGLEEIVW